MVDVFSPAGAPGAARATDPTAAPAGVAASGSGSSARPIGMSLGMPSAGLNRPMRAADSAVLAIAAWPELVEPLEQAREACTRLRFHEGLRRRIPEAVAESRVRGAWASARLEGARVPLRQVRDLVVGAAQWPASPDPTWDQVRGAVQVVAESEHIAGLLTQAGGQALARLHLAAAQPLAPEEQLGRPRESTQCAEFATLPDPPTPVRPRLDLLIELLRTTSTAPALVVAALAHSEIALVRPFEQGNGLIARAVERAIVRSRGLDPTGVAVPEYGHVVAGPTAYVGALSAYATGSREGLVLWIRHCAGAIVAAAQHGERVATAVRAGRLDDELI